jgi:hypothetical protein
MVLPLHFVCVWIEFFCVCGLKFIFFFFSYWKHFVVSHCCDNKYFFFSSITIGDREDLTGNKNSEGGGGDPVEIQQNSDEIQFSWSTHSEIHKIRLPASLADKSTRIG